jgi:hypothetical protein
VTSFLGVLARLIPRNADVVRGNSRFMPNRHCVSCTVDACLLLVIGVPVKSPFEQVHRPADSACQTWSNPVSRVHAEQLSLFTVQKSPIAWAVLDSIVPSFGHDNIRNNAFSESCAQSIRTGTWNHLVVPRDDDPGWSRHLRRVSPRFKRKRPSNRMVDRVQWLSGVTSIGWWRLRWG